MSRRQQIPEPPHQKPHNVWACWALFHNARGKVSAIETGFIIWMFMVTLTWGALSLYHMKMEELPASVVHISLALAGTKVAHRIADSNWEKILGGVSSIFKKN